MHGIGKALTGVVAVTLILAGGRGFAGPVQSELQRPVLDKVAGVYKVRFQNGDIDGDTYTSENIFELVELSKTTAYFRIHGEFYNGHTCDVWGIADLTNEALVYAGPINFENESCILKFTTNKDGIVVEDVGDVCRTLYCGARGSLGSGDEVTYPFIKRRAIKYLPLIMASEEFADAQTQYNAAFEDSVRRGH